MTAQTLGCCDGGCTAHCDNRFRFCYSDSEDATQITPVLRVRPEEVEIECQLASELVAANNDSIIFPKSGIFGQTVENPLEIRADVWPVRTISMKAHPPHSGYTVYSAVVT